MIDEIVQRPNCRDKLIAQLTSFVDLVRSCHDGCASYQQAHEKSAMLAQNLQLPRDLRAARKRLGTKPTTEHTESTEKIQFEGILSVFSVNSVVNKYFC